MDVNTLIRKHVATLFGMKRGHRFRPFIEFIQFPLYRNYRKDLRISFDFPLTAIVGQNGSGKTSLLQALSGAPDNHSTGRWWFGTAIDPLDEAHGTGRNLPAEYKAAFWYGYTDEDGSAKRAVKQRIKRSGDPDYWEPGRPIESYGMGDRDDRHPAVKMKAHYLNFKTQINAFDRCFYFAGNHQALANEVQKTKGWQRLQQSVPNSRRRKPRIQDYIRHKSKRLKRVLVDNTPFTGHLGRSHKRRVKLSQKAIKDISKILGRDYVAGALLEHRFYEAWGTSVLFQTGKLEYSEAFAGSGESAVARLVHAVHAANDSCLFLLDEPETSLHPGAQLELLCFLLRMAEEKKLQIVISTHSPAFVRHLPAAAIRVMSFDSSESVQAIENVPPEEAFYELGHPAENTIELVVEDGLCKLLVESVLLTKGEAFASRFSVTFRPGGETGMKQEAALTMLDASRSVNFLFDGDQIQKCGPVDLEDISVLTTSDEVDALLAERLGQKIKFRQDSNTPEETKLQTRLKFIEYLNANFFCLPFLTPEEAIWNDATAEQWLSMVSEEDALPKLLSESNMKERFSQLLRLAAPDGHAGNSDSFKVVHSMFVKSFCKSAGDEFQQLGQLLEEIADNA